MGRTYTIDEIKRYLMNYWMGERIFTRDGLINDISEESMNKALTPPIDVASIHALFDPFRRDSGHIIEYSVIDRRELYSTYCVIYSNSLNAEQLSSIINHPQFHYVIGNSQGNMLFWFKSVIIPHYPT